MRGGRLPGDSRAAQPERPPHEAEVLQHHAGLEVHEVRHELLDLPDGDGLPVARVVIQVAAAAARELRQPGRQWKRRAGRVLPGLVKAAVARTDVPAGYGGIHVIDTVVLPKS